jgi:hypothetical protein
LFCFGRIPRLRRGTGLYACIFFASGKKGYRFNPLRCCKTASMPFYSFEFLRAKTHESSQPASLPACLWQTPSIRRRRIAMEPEEPACAGEIRGAFRAGAFSARISADWLYGLVADSL